MATSKKPAKVKQSRTAEFVLGLIGGIFGLFGALFAMLVGGISSGLEEEGFATSGDISGDAIIGLGWLALILAIVGIVGAALVRSKTKQAGWMMLASGVGGLIAVSFAYLLATILLVTAGLMALLRGHGK